MSKTPTQKVQNTAAQTNGQQFRIRSQQTIYHHLFKALLASFKKNVSWKAKVIDLHDIEHVHHFHSVNSHGMPQKFTNIVGGHFHEVAWELGPNGEPVAKCGPALRKVTRKTPIGMKTVTEIVQWETYNDQGQPIMVQDKHSHTMQYIGTDVLTQEAIQATQKANSAAFVSPEPGATFENSEVSMVPAGPRE